MEERRGGKSEVEGEGCLLPEEVLHVPVAGPVAEAPEVDPVMARHLQVVQS